MKQLKLPLIILVGFFAAFTILSVITMERVSAAAVNTNIAPNPDNSNRYPHVFFMRKDADWGNNTNLQLRAYYPSNMTDAMWSNAWLKMRPGGANINDTWVCQKREGSMTYAEKNRYVTVTLRSDGVSPAVYHISYDKVCTGGQQNHDNETGVSADNVFFGRYALPGRNRPTLDNDTKRYIVDIEVAYNNALPSSRDNLGNTLRFDVQGNPASNVKIGMKGELRDDDNTNYYSFPIIGDARQQTDTRAASTNIPFGLGCNIDDTRRARIGIFDADNGGYYWPSTKVSFRVKEKGTSNYLRFIDGSDRRGLLTHNRTRFTPNDGEKGFASVSANFEPQTNYVMEIDGMVNRNIIDIHVPGDTIFGDVDCEPDSNWRIIGSSKANQTEVKRGDTATFTHTLKNNGANRSDSIASSVLWGTRGRITSGTLSGTTASQRYDGKGSSGASRSWTTSYVIPNTARDGDEYCQYIQWRATAWNNNGTSNSADDEACVTVRVETPPPITDRDVVLRAYVSGGGDSETLTQADFTGGVNVSNFPTATDGGWGYYELASQVGATRTTAQVSTNGTVASYSRTVYWCPTGYSGSPTSYSYYSCSRPRSQTTCPYGYSVTGTECYRISTAGAFYSGGSWQCPSGYFALGVLASGVTCYRIDYASQTTTSWTEYSYPNAQYEGNYYCAESSSWTGYITGGSPCRSYYVCPGGTSAGAGWAYSASSITCNSWTCQYGAAPFDSQIYMGSTAPRCEYRCPSTGGARPYLAPNTRNTTGGGELRCFIEPSFSLTCRWDTGATTVDTVRGNGNYCTSATTYKPTDEIGSVISATLTPLRPTEWLPANPQPGLMYDAALRTTRQHTRWGWVMFPATNSSNVVGMPYVKVYGGDVRVGGGVGASSGTCAANSSANIRTRNQGPSGYAGSGTQFAAISPGFISEFISGQYNELGTTPNPGSDPTRLTFANNAGGSGYGGGFTSGFGGGSPCYGYVERLPDDAEVLNGNSSISGRTINAGQKVVQHVRGNAYISGNVRYSGTWATAGSIPLYQLVVEGDIYIDDSVTQLDGVYAAIATNSSNGNIYTCSFVSGASATVPAQTYLGGSSNCKRQLVVNGALAAKKVHFLRDCGSLRWSANAHPEHTQYSGGTNDQYCGDTNHAAEIINFTPEVWIRSSAGSGGNKYDAISSMPPIL